MRRGLKSPQRTTTLQDAGDHLIQAILLQIDQCMRVKKSMHYTAGTGPVRPIQDVLGKSPRPRHCHQLDAVGHLCLHALLRA